MARKGFVWIVVLLLSTVACGEADDTPADSILGGDSSTNSTSQHDPTTGDDVGFDNDGGDINQDQGPRCIDPTSIGLLKPGQQGTVALALQSADGAPPACLASEDHTVSTAGLAFEVDEAALVEWTFVTDLPHHQLGTTIFEELCSAGEFCQSGRSTQHFFDGPATHLLEAAALDAPAGLSLHFRVDEAQCAPTGVHGCAEGDLQICHGGHQMGSYDCANQHCQGDHCGGDHCEQALEVFPGSAEEPTIIEGHRNGYTHTDHLSGWSDCFIDNIDDDRPEIFLAIDAIPADHDLVIESDAQGSYGFFAFHHCQATSCYALGSMDEKFQNRLRFSPSDDTTYLAIRPADPVARAFRFHLFAVPTDDL